jgi:hypothetical protein
LFLQGCEIMFLVFQTTCSACRECFISVCHTLSRCLRTQPGGPSNTHLPILTLLLRCSIPSCLQDKVCVGTFIRFACKFPYFGSPCGSMFCGTCEPVCPWWHLHLLLLEGGRPVRLRCLGVPCVLLLYARPHQREHHS